MILSSKEIPAYVMEGCRGEVEFRGLVNDLITKPLETLLLLGIKGLLNEPIKNLMHAL